LDIQKTKYV